MAKDVDDSTLARTDILNGLRGTCVNQDPHAKGRKKAHLEEDADSSKYHGRGGECLRHKRQMADFERDITLAVFTSPTTSPSVSENLNRTLTVGSSHFVNLPSTL